MFSGKRKLFIPLFLVLIAAGAVFWFSQSSHTDEALAADDATVEETEDAEVKDEKPAVPVELAAACSRDLPEYFRTTGSLQARRQVELIAKAQGQITVLNVEEGQQVAVGDIIMTLDHRKQELSAQQAKVKAETAELELARTENMVERGLVTEREFEEKKQIAQVAEVEFQLAEADLEDRIVRAPFSGRITTRSIELGQTVNVGDQLVGLAEVHPLMVELHLPEKIVLELALGQPVEVRSDAGRGEAMQGIVERIAPVVDPATSTIKVTLRVDDVQDQVRVGSFIRARVTTDVHEGAIAVPKKAIVPEAGASYLFVAEADSVRKVEVETGYADDTHIEIESGLDMGQQVVVVGQGGLRQGTRIRDLAAPVETETAEDEATENNDEESDEAQLAANQGS